MISGGLRAEFFNLGARQAIAIASHRHIMGSGSTGSKSKVLGLCWRTRWLSEGDDVGGGGWSPREGGDRWSVIGPPAISNTSHSPNWACLLLVLATRADQKTTPIDQSVGHLVTQSFSHSVIWSVGHRIRYGCRTAHLPAIPRPTHLDDASPMSNLPPVSHQSAVTPICFNSMTGNLADHILQDVGRLSFSRNLEIPLSNAVNLMGNARRNWLGLRLDFSTELRWAYNLIFPNNNA